MCVEHLQGWLAVATREDSTDDTNWLEVVDLVQTAFGEVFLEDDSIWKTVSLITKVTGNFQGTGLMEVIYKAVMVIFNQ